MSDSVPYTFYFNIHISHFAFVYDSIILQYCKIIKSMSKNMSPAVRYASWDKWSRPRIRRHDVQRFWRGEQHGQRRLCAAEVQQEACVVCWDVPSACEEDEEPWFSVVAVPELNIRTPDCIRPAHDQRDSRS